MHLTVEQIAEEALSLPSEARALRAAAATMSAMDAAKRCEPGYWRQRVATG
jgi:hypothetical protein